MKVVRMNKLEGFEEVADCYFVDVEDMMIISKRTLPKYLTWSELKTRNVKQLSLFKKDDSRMNVSSKKLQESLKKYYS